ncbi:DUF2326 domain-containing protein [Glutamicibacter soli]
MQLINLRVYERETLKTVKTVSFNSGANFVVDDSGSERHNKVGKTTFLRLIDVALGAKSRAMLWTDEETNAENTALKDLITKDKLCVELVIKSTIDDVETTLLVELFPRGQYKINGTRYSQKEYWTQLNQLFFENDQSSPSFRQLIGAFVRVSLSGDNNTLLRFLSGVNGNAEYRAIYSFLFRLSDPKIAKDIALFSAELNKVTDARSRFERLGGDQDMETLIQLRETLTQKKTEIERQINDFIDPSVFKQNRDKFIEMREEYMRCSDELSRASYDLDRAVESLEITRIKKGEGISRDIISEFYDEISGLLPNVSRTFDELVEFNRKLEENKIAFLQDSVGVLQSEVRKARQHVQSLEAEGGEFFALINNGRIYEYSEKIEDLNVINTQIGSTEESLRILDEFDSAIHNLSESIQESKDRIRDLKDLPDLQMEKFNRIFTPLSKRINGESPRLVHLPNPDKFPIKFAALDGTSTGTIKSLRAAYDFAYQIFAREEDIPGPKFVVHDIVESIEGEDFSEIVKLANESSIQYIVAVLQEKLDSAKIPEDIQNKGTIIRLASDSRVFE